MIRDLLLAVLTLCLELTLSVKHGYIAYHDLQYKARHIVVDTVLKQVDSVRRVQDMARNDVVDSLDQKTR